MKTPYSLPPSWPGSYLAWKSCTECQDCGRRGSYIEQPPMDPCPDCGGERIYERVGRWIITKTPRRFWFPKVGGYWQFKGEENVSKV